MKQPLLNIILPLAFAFTATAATETGSFLWNGTRNWARGGIASQSTTNFGGDAARGNDGNVSGAYGDGSVTHTDGAGAFWQVDLGTPRPIDQIVLWNRTDCCGFRLTNFRVSALDSVDTEVWGQNFYTAGGNVGLNEIINTPSGTSASKVKVAFLDANPFLSLAEVQVLNIVPAAYANVALGKTASQSSLGYGGTPDRAVDGNTSGQYGDNSVTHTDDLTPTGAPVFWEVDLAGDFSINEIALYNRTDCCSGRLSNFRLSVFDGPVEIWGENYFTAGGSAATIFSVHDTNTAAFSRRATACALSTSAASTTKATPPAADR
jgi:F5/8 type C domain